MHAPAELGAMSVAARATVCYTSAMSRTIPQRELRNNNAEIIDAVVAGDTFIITRNGEPVAELRPLLHARRRYVPKADLIRLAASGPHIDWSAFRADIDALLDQSLTQ